MSEDDRRRNHREHITLKVEYGEASELVSDYTENISNGGTFVLTSRSLPVGTEIKLVLSFPGLIKPLPMTGIVKWIRSGPPDEQGVGLEFDLSNPEIAARYDALVRRIADGDPELIARNLRVLVVEDNPHVANLIRDGLSGGSRRELAGRVSFQFTTVNNGRDALDALAAQPFDVIIIDIYLPVMDGAQVITHVRADAALKHLPIVAVSAGGSAAREAALAAGADFFLEKPMRLADIVATMRRLTGLI
jgi:uncharacterized protein (TIGR02266 family)